MPDCHRDLFSPDHRPHTERSTFYRIYIGLPILLESNFGVFRKVAPLATRAFRAFVVTRQLQMFGFSALRDFFRNLSYHQRVLSLVILMFCHQLDDPFFCVFRQCETFSRKVFIYACKGREKTNKPGTAQVGAISKAQKESFKRLKKGFENENHFFYNWRQQNLSKN